MEQKEKIVIFGAGRIGKRVAKMMRYDKDVLYVVDNDSKKWGLKVEGVAIHSPEMLLDNLDIKIVIAVADYPPIVMQLENMGCSNYVYYSDVYGWQLDCKSRIILDRHIAERCSGQYSGRDIKNAWMNHMNCWYGGKIYEKYLVPNARTLDVGCGCGTNLFFELLNGCDAYGLECCKWKIDFCKQKIEDFCFPEIWKEKLIFGYGEELPFSDNYFDVVSSCYVLEHVNDWRKCLQEMIRVVKPGGVMFINGPDYRNSYEEHYGIDIGRPINESVEILKEKLIERHESLDIFEELNFITKPLVLSELEKDNVKIYDRETEGVRVDKVEGGFRIWRRIDLIVEKTG